MDALTDLLFQYYKKDVPKTPILPSQTKNTGEKPNFVQLAPVRGTQIDISTTGRQLNELSKTVSSDSAAKEGLRNFVKESGRAGLAQSAPLVTSLRELQTSDKTSLQGVFRTASELAKNGEKTTSFLNTVVSLNSDQRKGFLSEINNALGAQGASSDRRKTANGIMSTVSDIMKTSDVDDQEKLMSDLFQGLSSKTDLKGKTSFLEDFRKNQLKNLVVY